MPFKSEAQRRKFHAMAARGEIDEATVREWENATPDKKRLPMHVKRAYVEGYASAVKLAYVGLLRAVPTAAKWGAKLLSHPLAKNVAGQAALNAGVTAVSGGGVGDVAQSAVTGSVGGVVGGAKRFANKPMMGQMAGMGASMGADHAINSVFRKQQPSPTEYNNSFGQVP